MKIAIRSLLCSLLLGAVGLAQAAKPAPPPTLSKQARAKARQQQQLVPQNTPEEDLQMIRALESQDIKARMAFDVDSLTALWSDDIVSMPPNHAPIEGYDANRAYLQQQADDMKKMDILDYNQQWQEVLVFGDTAAEWGTISGRIKPMNGGGAEIEYKYNAVRVLRKQHDGSWKIARSIWNDANPAAAAVPAEGTTPPTASPADVTPTIPAPKPATKPPVR